MTLVAGRDPDALAALYDRYGKVAYSLARRILSDEQLAQEVVQEVFLSLWGNADRFDPSRASVSSYLLSITHHRAVDVVRREENQRRRRVSDQVLELEADPGVDVEGDAVSAERARWVRSALAGLPAPQREALALAYFGGYTQREVAELAAVPLGTVKTRMAAGMRKLQGRPRRQGLGRGWSWPHP